MLLESCLPYLLFNFSSEQELIESIREISTKFTENRVRIGDYLVEPRLVSAYTAFYLTTNYPKLGEVMKWLPDGWREGIKNADFIDLGAGPGTFSLAWKELNPEYSRIYQIETSGVMKNQAKKLWEGIYPDKEMIQLHSPKELPGSVLFFGHSANEMGVEKVLEYIDIINPDHILFIEPGTKDFFFQMRIIRRELIGRKFNVLFPCPTHDECPMGLNDWCHQYINVRHDPDVERLSQKLHLDRKLLPLTVQCFSRTYSHHKNERVVRVHSSTKFSFEWDVCRGDKVEHYQIQKRGLEKIQLKRLDEVLSGDSIESTTDKLLEGFRRVKLLKINNTFSS